MVPHPLKQIKLYFAPVSVVLGALCGGDTGTCVPSSL